MFQEQLGLFDLLVEPASNGSENLGQSGSVNGHLEFNLARNLKLLKLSNLDSLCAVYAWFKSQKLKLDFKPLKSKYSTKRKVVLVSLL